MRSTLCLDQLRASQLLSEAQLARLESSWDGRFRPLVEAGLLTPYQARQIARGRLDRLRLGPYVLLERLGGGGEGVVFKAVHALMGREVALKILRRTTSEIAITAGLTHPHIVQAYDASYHRGRVLLALELVDGVDLARVLAETGPLPFALVETLAVQVASALEYLHRRGLVHRDVKPANLILIPDAVQPQVKLIDMGLTCPVGEDSLCGSPDYLAPERGLGDPADVRGDLYSLGCTLYELLTGRVPYPGGDRIGKMLRHRLEEPIPLEQARPQTPLHLVELVRQLMERDPERRLANPQQVPLLLRPVPPVAPPRPALRWRWAFAALCGLFLGGAARLAAEFPLFAAAVPAIEADGQAVAGDLAMVLAQAPAGAVITLHHAGPYEVKSLHCTQPLTLRAAPGVHPVLLRRNAPAREPMLQTTAELRLEGITFRDEADTPTLWLRKAACLSLHRCTIESRRQAVHLELPDTGPLALELSDCEVCVHQREGAVLFACHAETTPASALRLQLRRCTLSAGRILALQVTDVPVWVEETACRLHYRQDRVSCGTCPDFPEDRVQWQVK
jgi:hypothetical protein